MSNIVLATKWRPKLFSDLIGQDPVVTALINSLDNQRLHHSYLFMWETRLFLGFLDLLKM